MAESSEGKEISIGVGSVRPETVLLERLQKIPDTFPDRQQDRLLGAAIETDGNRSALMDLISDTLKAGRHFAIVYTDVDRLKGWNDTYGHGAGDIAIQHSAASVGKVIDQTFPDGAQNPVITLRGHFADETFFYILNLKEEQITAIEELNTRLQKNSPASLPEYPKLKFTTSTGVVFSANDQEHKARTQKALENLEGTEANRPYELVNTLKTEAETKTGLVKLKKIEKALDRVGRVLTFTDYLKAVDEEFGGTMRIPGEVLQQLITMGAKKYNQNR